MFTYDMEKSENSSHDRYQTSEHNKKMHIDGSSSIYFAKCNQIYISASVNIVKISILTLLLSFYILGCALMVLGQLNVIF